ncbi:sensor histidine kinase [Portibacter lacus]|uniref:histidine kinase n=1 Tax=Portibacter lacus TaxID=1099794 RepID=A0AA37WDB3_9BACT|nr:histidine kinase [Portibacter lacus]GLR15584.1 hypothetical protein GCM10007940_01990 [Portibacter lacus]
MKLKHILAIVPIFLIQLVFCQSENSRNNPLHHYQYGIDDGFDITVVNSMIIGNDGWVWISGLAKRLDLYKNENLDGIIQRFNGMSFQRIALPSDLSGFYWSIDLFNKPNGEIIVSVTLDDFNRYYTLNPETLEYKEIIIPLKKDVHYHASKIFNYKGKLLICVNSEQFCKIYEVGENNKAELFAEITSDRSGFVSDIGKYDEGLILHDSHVGIHFLDLKTRKSSIISPKSIDPNFSEDPFKHMVKNLFTYNDTIYYQFHQSPDFYSFDPASRKWSKSSYDNIDLNIIVKSDDSGHIFQETLVKNGSEFAVKDSLGDVPSKGYYIEGSRQFKHAAVNIHKSLYLAENGTFHQLIFESNQVATFLTQYSIRSIMKIEKDRYLVATELNGYFIVDPKKRTTEPFEILLNGKPFIPFFNRNLFKSGNTLWTNNENGVCKIDLQTHELTQFIYFPAQSMVEDGNYIYTGTTRFKLLRFDKEKEIYEDLDLTDTLNFQDIDLYNGKVLGATEKGLYIYHKGNSKLLIPDQTKSSEYLLSISKHPVYKFLIGSRSGKLYSFDPDKEQFKLIYQDALEASIADVQNDEKGNLWISTFGGFVKYNPKTKTQYRFNEDEGFTNYEANRYSAFENEEGYLFLGTLKGLNYFHPDSLLPSSKSSTLVPISLQYFSKKENKVVKKIDVLSLQEANPIVLPPENRNLTYEYSVLGENLVRNIKYHYRINDGEWSKLGSSKKIDLINIAPGRYNLEIEAISFNQKKIGNSLYLEIIAKDFFYRTWWFLSLTFLGMFAIIFWYFIASRNRVRMHETFSRDIITAQETQLTEIARELHDSVGQKLVLLSMKIKVLGDKSSELLTKETLEELRAISSGLHPSVLERHGLTAAIQSLVNSIDESTDTFIEAEIDPIDNLFPPKSELHIYRIIQEALNNMVKHSNAQSASFKVKKTASSVLFSLQDFGKGFKFRTENLNHLDGLGMKTLVERSKILDAKLEIETSEGKGTRIKLFVPIQLPQ